MDDQKATRAESRPAGLSAGADERIGTILAGRYRLVKLLGEGAQGVVYIGEHLRIGRRDAIKILRHELLEDPEAVARFTRGASKASRISHPNVCTVYDFGDTEDGLPFMASELVDGRELQEIMEEEAPFSLERAVDVVEQIALGLEAAHELGIVHRDLKPANVMIERSRDGRDAVKVVDFDIAKGIGESEASALTKVGWVVGTPRYMSPEQITGGELDGRSDIYSLGLILFELLAGEPPNDVASSQRLMWERVNNELRTLDEMRPEAGFPRELQAVLDAALAADRDRRPTTAREFAQRIRAVAPAPSVPAPGPTDDPSDATVVIATTPRRRRPSTIGGSRRRRAIVAGIGAIATLIVGASMSLGDFGSEPPLALVVPEPVQIEAGERRPLEVRLVHEETGQPVEGPIEYQTMDPSVATVDEAGMLHALTVGSTSVVLRAAGLTKRVTVTVTGQTQDPVVADASDATGPDVPPAEGDPEPIRGRQSETVGDGEPPPRVGSAAGTEGERSSGPTLTARELSVESWSVAEEPSGPAVRITTRFSLESPQPIDWCVAARYRRGGEWIRSSDGSSNLGGIVAAYRTLRSPANRQPDTATLSMPIEHLQVPLEWLNARGQVQASAAVWPKACSAVGVGEAPVAESDAPTTVCLVHTAAGITADPLCRS